jgi:hypothetical protein
MFVVDRGQKVVRRRVRLNAFKNAHNGAVWVLNNPKNKDLQSFVRLLEIPAERLIGIEALPDVYVAKRGGGAGSGVKPTGVYNETRHRYDANDVPDTVELWLPLSKGNSVHEIYKFGSRDPRAGFGNELNMLNKLGVSKKLYLLTPKAQKAYSVDDATRLDVMLIELVKKNVDNIGDAMYNTLLRSELTYTRRKALLLENLDLTRETDGLTFQTGSSYMVRNFLTLSDNPGKMVEIEKAVAETISTLTAKYPLCFDGHDEQHLIDYINYRKAQS